MSVHPAELRCVWAKVWAKAAGIRLSASGFRYPRMGPKWMILMAIAALDQGTAALPDRIRRNIILRDSSFAAHGRPMPDLHSRRMSARGSPPKRREKMRPPNRFAPGGPSPQGKPSAGSNLKLRAVCPCTPQRNVENSKPRQNPDLQVLFARGGSASAQVQAHQKTPGSRLPGVGGSDPRIRIRSCAERAAAERPCSGP
ncbi:hypothetical protein BRAS3843_2900036 [Bradyrhizobium sp. STM 3843]|nr:hypothetical protein BRAS3843_2900036 [Bradyrhizobium sp. STM 3843]